MPPLPLLLKTPGGAYTDVRFASYGTTRTPFYASAGPIKFTASDSQSLKNDNITHSEWEILASSTNENDVERGDYLPHGGDFLKIRQTTDLKTGQMMTCQELWTSIPMHQNQMEEEITARPYLLVASIRSGKEKGQMIRLGDYWQGVAQLEDYGLHLERWRRVANSKGRREWVKDHQSTTWIHQEENFCLPGDWLCSDERRIGYGTITMPSTCHIIWYVVEESWL